MASDSSRTGWMPAMHHSIHGTAVAAVLVTAVVFLADRLTKQFFYAFPMAWHGPIASIVTLVHHENHGIIANLPVPQPIIIAVTLMIIAVVLGGLLRSIHRNEMQASIALGILIGGALGNLFDRAVNGYVFDWILLFGRSAINLADASIVIGVVFYLGTLTDKKDPVV